MNTNINKIIFGFIRIALGILILLFIIRAGVELSKVGYDFGYRVFTEPAVDEAPGKDVLVQINENTSLTDLAQLLEEKGLVRDAKLFVLQTELSVYRKKIVPGVYTLNTSMTAKEMLAIMSSLEDETESTEIDETTVAPDATKTDESVESSDESGEEQVNPGPVEEIEDDVDQDML